MYKMLFFLNKTDDKNILNHFNDFTLKYISAVASEEIKAGYVESNLLLEHKFSRMCELTSASKDEMDRMLGTLEGKALNKELMDFHKHITIISVNYK
jgi:hypothetical protein